MNKQIIIMLIAACTTALWGIVHSSQGNIQMPMAMPTGPTSAALPTTAQIHFDKIDTTALETIINEAKELTAKFKIHAEIETVYLSHIKTAFEAGLRTGLMVSGQYMQAGLNAMGNKMKTMTVIQPARPIGSN